MLLEAGNVVPADLRLFESASIEVNESLLTGESQGVSKHADVIDQTKLAVADASNMVFKGSQINHGRGQGVVIAIGMDTELGKIATLLQKTVDSKTPLQQRLTLFGKRLALAVLAICVVIFVVGLLRGEAMLVMLLTAVSLAVAAIPEALPAVISVALALGAWRMIKHQALVRNLPAVETLGSVTYICVDKTGTLTQNRMTAETFFVEGALSESIPDSALRFCQALALSNDVDQAESGLKGDPTELALYLAAKLHGYDKQALQQQLPRIAELPFDSGRKRMSTLHQNGDEVLVFCKGAPEQLLPLCPAADQQALLQQAEALASQGYRVLALASRNLVELPTEISEANVEAGLEFLGLVALIDPPRDEVTQAVQDCLSAGITPVMITGDHPATALAISKRLGIAETEQQLLTGHELAELDMAQMQQRVRQLRVYARVSPNISSVGNESPKRWLIDESGLQLRRLCG